MIIENALANPCFRRLEDGCGIQPILPLPEPSLGGDMHETFTVDAHGNITGGHTTVRLPGGDHVRMPWE